MLEIAAILGPRFRLRSLLGAAEQSMDQDALLDAVDDAIAARVLREVDEEPDVCEFEHAIIRDAIESALSKSRGIRLHLAAGRALEGPPGTQVSRRSRFTSQRRCRSRPPTKSCLHARRAGDRAMSLLAFEEAVDHYTRALDAVERAATNRPSNDARCCSRSRAHTRVPGRSRRPRDRRNEPRRSRVRWTSTSTSRALALVFEGELVSGAEFWEWRLAMLEEANKRLRVDSELRRACHRDARGRARRLDAGPGRRGAEHARRGHGDQARK